MKLFRFGDDGKEKPLALLEGKHYDASAFLAKVLAKSFLNQMDWKIGDLIIPTQKFTSVGQRRHSI